MCPILCSSPASLFPKIQMRMEWWDSFGTNGLKQRDRRGGARTKNWTVFKFVK